MNAPAPDPTPESESRRIEERARSVWNQHSAQMKTGECSTDDEEWQTLTAYLDSQLKPAN